MVLGLIIRNVPTYDCLVGRAIMIPVKNEVAYVKDL